MIFVFNRRESAVRKIKEEVLCEGRWLIFLRSYFLNAKGEEVYWESVMRRTRGASVVVIARLVPSGRYILIKQFRQSLNGFVIGFPAGITYTDAGHGLRELKEETGFTGRLTGTSPVLKTTIGITDEDCRVITVDVDENDLRNQNPLQELDPSEEIEVLLIPRDDIKAFLLREQENGTHIAAGVWYVFCLGA